MCPKSRVFNSDIPISVGCPTDTFSPAIGNSACLFVCVSVALAQLTDKMDPCIIHQNDYPEFHDDAHQNKSKKNEDNLPSNSESKSYWLVIFLYFPGSQQEDYVYIKRYL